MATKQAQIITIAQHFHSGDFGTLRTTLDMLRAELTVGRLSRHEQAALLELAEYGLFYTRFYETLLQRMRTPPDDSVHS